MTTTANQIDTHAVEGNVIGTGTSIERKLWSVGRGEHADSRVVGVFAGTETGAVALVAELNASRRHVDEYDGAITYKGDEYWFQEVAAIRSAADLIG